MFNKLRNQQNHQKNRTQVKNDEKHLEFNTERLERREMLAGDVSVSVRGGDLVIRGDAAANQLTVSHQYFPNGYLITGNSGTTINGQTSFLATGVTDDIRVNLKAGNDVLDLRNSSPNDLKFVGSHGNDVLALSNVTVRGNLVASMGSGGDGVDIRNSTVFGSTRIKTSHGDSQVNFAGSRLRGDVQVNGGSGRDNIFVAESRFDRSLSGKLKGGNDTVRIANSQFFGQAKFHGGHGFDSISVFPNEPANFEKISFEG